MRQQRAAKISRQIVPFFTALAGALASLGSAPAAATGSFMPHTAHYSLKLLPGATGLTVDSVGGEMLMKWEASCEGWIQTQRLVIDVGYRQGEAVRLAIDISTWESRRGDRYRFNYRTRLNDKVVDVTEGEATLGPEGGQAVFVQPKKATFPLAADTVFPIRHTEQLLSKAGGAPAIYSAQLFDGHTVSAAALVNAVIGPPDGAKPDAGRSFAALKNRVAWPVQLAFFSAKKSVIEPEAEIGARIFDNGVTDWLDIDLASFKIRAELKNLKMGEQPSCPR